MGTCDVVAPLTMGVLFDDRWCDFHDFATIDGHSTNCLESLEHDLVPFDYLSSSSCLSARESAESNQEVDGGLSLTVLVDIRLAGGPVLFG